MSATATASSRPAPPAPLSSAETLVYADGLLLSNLLGNSYNDPPRWGVVP